MPNQLVFLLVNNRPSPTLSIRSESTDLDPISIANVNTIFFPLHCSLHINHRSSQVTEHQSNAMTEIRANRLRLVSHYE